MSTKKLDKLCKRMEAALSVATPGPSGAASSAKKKNRRKKRASAGSTSRIPGTLRGPSRSSANGEFTLTRKEYLGQLDIAASGDKFGVAKGIFLAPPSFPWLAKLSKSFERYRWNSLSIHYIPDVGTSKDGSIAIGIDWDTETKPATGQLLRHPGWLAGKDYTRESVVALTPSVVTPLWKPYTMVVPKDLLQSRAWYTVPDSATVPSNPTDYGTGSVAIVGTASSAVLAGDLWVTYNVTFAGTHL